MVDDCFNHRAPVWGYADISKKTSWRKLTLKKNVYGVANPPNIL